MILVVIAIFLFLVAIGIYLIIKQKKSEYKDVKKEKIVFSVLVILAIILIIVFLLTPTQIQEEKNIYESLPEEVFEVEVTLSYANSYECGNNYCIEGEIDTVNKGNFYPGQKIVITSDCFVQTYGGVEVKGKETEKGIFAICGDVIDLGIDPMMYQIPGEETGLPQ